VNAVKPGSEYCTLNVSVGEINALAGFDMSK